MHPSKLRVGQVTPHMLLTIGGTVLGVALLLLAVAFFARFFGTTDDEATRNSFSELGNAMNALKAQGDYDVYSYVEVPVFIGTDYVIAGFDKGQDRVYEACPKWIPPNNAEHTAQNSFEKGPECGDNACICLYRYEGGHGAWGNTQYANNFVTDTCIRLKDMNRVVMLGYRFLEELKASPDWKVNDDWARPLIKNFRGGPADDPLIPIDIAGNPYNKLVLYGECEMPRIDEEFQTRTLYVERTGLGDKQEITVAPNFHVFDERKLLMEKVEKDLERRIMLEEEKKQILQEMQQALTTGRYGEIAGLHVAENRNQTKRTTWQEFEKLNQARKRYAAIAAYRLSQASTQALEYEAKTFQTITGTRLTADEMRNYLSIDYPGKTEHIQQHKEYVKELNRTLAQMNATKDAAEAAKLMYYSRAIAVDHAPPEIKFPVFVLAVEAYRQLQKLPPSEQAQAYSRIHGKTATQEEARKEFAGKDEPYLTRAKELVHSNPELVNHEHWNRYQTLL